jgi:hypothetical protein
MALDKIIEDVILKGPPAEKMELFGFCSATPRKRIATKFKLFARGCFPRYFQYDSADFHNDFIADMIASYYGENRLNAAFRGSAKTSLKKLFDVFVLLNDNDAYRKFIKVLARDGKNSQQIVTDVYNLIVELRDVYGNPFEVEGDIKHEERMNSFTMKNGRKYSAGTVGQTQRGHLQDAYRPDWLWFEDVEDRESIRSMVITSSTIGRVEEAIDGLSKDGSYFVTCNYISDQGVVQWFMDKQSVKTRITPLLADAGDDSSCNWKVFDEAKIRAIRADSEDWWGEYQCLKPDTMVATDNGWKQIQEIRVGDYVWTHKLRLKKVLKVFQRQAQGLLDITTGGNKITITGNHPILIQGKKRKVWKAAERLTTNDLLIDNAPWQTMDMVKKRFGKWVVIDREAKKMAGAFYVFCACDCGTKKWVRSKNLKSGQSKSCGCINKEKLSKRNLRHNRRYTKEWRVWQAMKNRCYNKKVAGYKYYGGRGISVCKCWRESFLSFLNDVGEAPDGTGLDRINNDGNYEPCNVRWASRKEQAQNRRSNRKINGECITYISKRLGGASHSLVANRLRRGWEFKSAITTPVNGE